MKKNKKQIAAIVALFAIAALLIGFIVSAFQTSADSRNTFFAFFFCIIAIPILLWLLLLCYGRFKGKHTMAEFFPESSTVQDLSATNDTNQDNVTTEK